MNARRKKLIILFTCALVGAVFAWRFFARREPSYNGKPLTAWAEQWGANHWHRHSSAEAAKADKEAELAIQHIGTNGIPFLLDLMRTRDSVFTAKLRSKLPRAWQAKIHSDRASILRHAGAHGLAALGTNAGPAVQGLMELISRELVRDPPDRNDGYLPIWTVGFLGSTAEPAVPLLLQALTNRNDSIRLEAAHKLGQIGSKPEMVVPALVRYLEMRKQDNGNAERSAAIQSIGIFGTNASSATSTLVSLLGDSDPSIREAATNWLPYLDRATAKRLGIRIPWER